MKSLRIHYLQHVPFEGLGCIEKWVREKGHQLTVTRLYNGESFPGQDEVDWLIIMGGPMGVYEEVEYPWLNHEKAFIREVIEKDKTVLGICLGAQLIADALGAKVITRPEKEIGWFPIRKTKEERRTNLLKTMPETLPVFHWHGDMFEIPEGAVGLALSEACPNQAFLYQDRVLGLQFHFEATPETVRDMLSHGKNELEGSSPFVQSMGEIKKGVHFCQDSNKLMYSLLEGFESLGAEKRKTSQDNISH